MPLMNTSNKTSEIGGLLTAFPDGVTYLPAYLMGLRAPFEPTQVQNGSYENNYNDAFSEGTRSASLHVLPLGVALGVAGVLLYQHFRR